MLVFPELSITTYTCGDLFFNLLYYLLPKSGLYDIVKASQDIDIFAVVGLPLSIDNQLFNCAVAIYKGTILGVVPKVVYQITENFMKTLVFFCKTAFIKRIISLWSKSTCWNRFDILSRTNSLLQNWY